MDYGSGPLTILSVACGATVLFMGVAWRRHGPGTAPCVQGCARVPCDDIGLGNHEARFPGRRRRTHHACFRRPGLRSLPLGAACAPGSSERNRSRGRQRAVVGRHAKRGAQPGAGCRDTRDPGAYRRRLTGGCMPCERHSVGRVDCWRPGRGRCGRVGAGHLIAATGCGRRPSRVCIVPGPWGSGGSAHRRRPRHGLGERP